jgi:hypothetical protein
LSKKDQQSDEPTPKFKIVDRRHLEDVEPEPILAPPSDEKPASEEPDQEIDKDPVLHVESSEPLPEVETEEPESQEDPLGYRNVTLSFLQTLSTISWVHLGLVPHPQTQLMFKKLDEARKTIALFEVIFNQSKSEFPPEINKEITGLLNDLKAHYVNQL